MTLDLAGVGRQAEAVTALFQPFPMLPGRRAQVWRHQPSFRRPRHFHAEPELNVVARGSGVMAIGERHLQVQAGDVILLQPGQDHALLAESHDFDLFVFALSPELAKRASIPEHQHIGKQRVTVPLMAELCRSLTAIGGLADTTSVESQLAEHFLLLAREFNVSHVLCRRALDLLRTDTELSETQLAEVLQTEPSSISRQVHACLGVRLVEYRARLRLIGFIQRVGEGRPLTRAAFEGGFGSYAQCHRVFQRVMGCSPSAYFGGEDVRLNAAVELFSADAQLWC